MKNRITYLAGSIAIAIAFNIGSMSGCAAPAPKVAPLTAEGQKLEANSIKVQRDRSYIERR